MRAISPLENLIGRSVDEIARGRRFRRRSFRFSSGSGGRIMLGAGLEAGRFPMAQVEASPLTDISKHLAELRRLGMQSIELHVRLPTTDQLRANLVVASLAATFLQAWVLLAIAALGVPQSVFTSSAFRLVAMSFVACVVIAVHVLANASFHVAIERGHVRFGGGHDRAVLLSPYCSRRLLVVLHLRFRGRAFRVGDADYQYAAQR